MTKRTTAVVATALAAGGDIPAAVCRAGHPQLPFQNIAEERRGLKAPSHFTFH